MQELVKKQIVLWKLGSLEHKIIPTQSAINALKEKISQIKDGGHLVWGPDLSVEIVNIIDGEHKIVSQVEIDGELYYKVEN